MQQDNANKKCIISKNMTLFVAHKSFKTHDIIDSKIDTLNIMTTFSISWRVDRVESRNCWFEFDFKSNQEVDIEYLSRIRRLISSIRVKSNDWYQVSRSN